MLTDEWKKTWESLAEHLTALRKIVLSLNFRAFKTLPIFQIFSSFSITSFSSHYFCGKLFTSLYELEEELRG